MKRIFLTLALIAGIGGFGLSTASAQVGIYVHLGPPAPRYESVPPRPGPGYAWRPGYWGWAGGRWVWNGGIWVSGHGPSCWVRPHYTPRGYWIPGHWRC